MTASPPALTYPPDHDVPRALLLGACSFAVSFALGLASDLADEPFGAWLTAASFVVWIPAVRALLLIAAGIESRALWRATLGMFWSELLLEVFVRGTDTDDRGAAGLVVLLAWLGTIGVLVYLFRPAAQTDATKGTVKLFAIVGAGLLVALKALAKLKFFAAHAAVRGAGGLFKTVSLEGFEIALTVVLSVWLFASLFAIAIVLVRRGARDRLFAVCGWVSLASLAATLVLLAVTLAAAIDDKATEPPMHDLVLEVPHAVWTLAMLALLLTLRRRALPAAPDRLSLTG